MCSPSLHLLLVFFLVVRLPLQLLLFRRSFFFTGSVYGFLATRSIRVDCWILKFFTRQTLELPTDRPTNRKSAKKTVRFSEKLTCLHEFWLSVIFERQGLVFFVEQHDFDDPGIDDLINEEPSPISGTRRARHVGGRRRDTHTAKVRTHGQTLLFYRYR